MIMIIGIIALISGLIYKFRGNIIYDPVKEREKKLLGVD